MVICTITSVIYSLIKFVSKASLIIYLASVIHGFINSFKKDTKAFFKQTFSLKIAFRLRLFIINICFYFIFDSAFNTVCGCAVLEEDNSLLCILSSGEVVYLGVNRWVIPQLFLFIYCKSAILTSDYLRFLSRFVKCSLQN